MNDEAQYNRTSHIAHRLNNTQNQNEQNKIHVALSVYDPSGKYSQHAGVVMTSIFENTQSPVMIHILHDETLTDDNRQKFLRTAEKYNQEVNLIDVTEYAKHITGEAFELFKRTFSIGAAYRLFIPGLIKADKAIYLDCDIVVNVDIKELWNIDINNYCLAASLFAWKKEPELTYCRLQCMINKCKPSEYFNAGVMLMNLANIRKDGDLFENASKWLERHLHSSRGADQDILNSLFSGRVKFLDDKFNLSSRYFNTLEEARNCIIHTPGDSKPWEFSGRSYQYLYRDHYLKSAWGENATAKDIIYTILDEAAAKNKPKARHNIFKRIFCRTYNELHNSQAGQIFILLYKELLYRIGLKK